VLNFFAAKRYVAKVSLQFLGVRALWADLRHGFHAALSYLSANASQSLATIVLGMKAPPDAVAKFGAALIMTTAAKQVLFPISQVVFAHSTAARARGSALSKNSRIMAYGVILGLGLATWLVIYVAAAFVIPLVFGDKFGGSVPVLKVMAPIPLVFIVGQTAALEFLFAKNLGRLVSRGTVVGTAVCVAASFLLVGNHQAMGIGVAILLGECVATAFILAAAVWASRSRVCAVENPEH
jgi:O-antigen/teichoic acid export membrane protein